MDVTTATFQEKDDFESQTFSYTLTDSSHRLELTFSHRTYSNSLEYVDTVFHRNVIELPALDKPGGFLAFTPEALIEKTNSFDLQSWKHLNQDFRESFDEGSVYFRRQFGQRNSTNAWAQDISADLQFSEDGLKLTWGFNELRTTATIAPDRVPGCLAFMRAPNVQELLTSMSSHEDQRWRDLCRYFESQAMFLEN